jgi:hypothetical protein
VQGNLALSRRVVTVRRRRDVVTVPDHERSVACKAHLEVFKCAGSFTDLVRHARWRLSRGASHHQPQQVVVSTETPFP